MRTFDNSPGSSDRFELIETTRWSPEEGLWLLDYHLDRLQHSARYFGFTCDLIRIREVLDAHTGALDPSQRWRIRLTLARDGTAAVTSSRMADTPAGAALPTATLSDRRTDSSDIFLRHKTTNRHLYDSEFSRAQLDHGCIEVLFRNERGELTEGSRTNLFVELNGVLHTPPLRCGLLDGTVRRSLLSQARTRIKEAIVSLEDLSRAEKILIGNSVIGLTQVQLIDSGQRQIG